MRGPHVLLISSVERLQVKVEWTDRRSIHRYMQRTTIDSPQYRDTRRIRRGRALSAHGNHHHQHCIRLSVYTRRLSFDIIDTWNGRAIGGCTYHVSHPGGRHYDTFPVNAYEAEARRTTRFGADGHTPGVIQSQPAAPATGQFLAEGTPLGPIDVPPEETNAEYPYTLDLRRIL